MTPPREKRYKLPSFRANVSKITQHSLCMHTNDRLVVGEEERRPLQHSLLKSLHLSESAGLPTSAREMSVAKELLQGWYYSHGIVQLRAERYFWRADAFLVTPRHGLCVQLVRAVGSLTAQSAQEPN